MVLSAPSLRIVVCLAVLTVLKAAAPAHSTELEAGVAKAVITPELGKQPIGVMGEPLTGLNHDLYARVLVLDDGVQRLVIVTYDLNCLDVATPILRQRLRDELGIGPAYFIPLATHNHAAPIQIVPDNFEYGRKLAEIIFGLVQEAIAGEQGPVRVEFGAGAAYWLRSLGNAPADFEVQVLRVTREGSPVAVLFNHPVHPLQVAYDKIGVGHPGYAVEEVEARLPGVQAMYWDACGGNQFTLKGMEAPMEEVRAQGRALADTVLGIASASMQEVTGPLSSALDVISLPLAKPMPLEDARQLASHYPSGIGFVPYPHPDRETNWVRSLMDHYNKQIPFPTRTTDRVCTDDGFLVKEYDTPREFPCRYEETIVATIGPLIFVAMQGEVCAPIGMRIKDAFRGERPIMLGAYMGEHNLYIPTREIVRLNLYQAQVIQIQYASPVGWAPTVEDEVVAGVKQLVRSAIR